MATPHCPLGETNSNIESYKDLPPYIRGKTMGKMEEGKKLAQIAAELQIPDSTIQDTLRNDPLRSQGISQKHTGWPKKHSDRFK